MRHVVLIRLNLPCYSDQKGVRFDIDDAWVLERCQMLEAGLLLCLDRQTDQDFEVKIMAYKGVSEAVRARINGLNLGNVEVHWFGDNYIYPGLGMYMAPALVPLCQKVVGKCKGPLVTTCMDTDDLVAFDFVECLKKEVDPGEWEFLNFLSGYYEDSVYVYPKKRRHNMFLSLVEPKPDVPLTVFHVVHTQAQPVRDIYVDTPFWRLRVHGNNKSTKIKQVSKKLKFPKVELDEKRWLK